MSAEAGVSLEWLRRFQIDYLKHGVKGTDAQVEHLQKLAQHYEEEFDRTKNWKDAFKVFFYRCSHFFL